MIPYGRQDIINDDIDAVIEVLKSDFITQGPQVPLFESAIKSAVNVKYACALNSATSGLHVACLALGVGKGDLVWTSPVTFVASANCALYCGAEIDFVDIDPKTYNLCPMALEEKLSDAKRKNLPLPKVVIPVHLCGQSCEMDKIHALSIEYGFAIIEDASHAIGGKYQNSPIGNCQYSDITVFSFHPVKIVTTGEGGAVTTNNEAIAKKINLYRTHGITRDEKLMKNSSQGGWYYEQIALGLNYRMTDIQAALGVSQMSRLNDFILKRNKLAERYDASLNNLPLVIPHQIEDSFSSRHLYVIRLKLDKISLSHKEVFNKLRENGIGVNLHYIPVHLHPYYRDLGFTKGQFPISETYYRDAISIPLFSSMTTNQQDEVINILTSILKNSS